METQLLAQEVPCAWPGPSLPQRSPCPHLDVDLVTQHSRPQDHGFGTALELLAHEQGLLEGGAALVHITSIQDLLREAGLSWAGARAHPRGAPPL